MRFAPTSNVFFPAGLITGQGFFLLIEAGSEVIEGGEFLQRVAPG